jgi:diadenosine tetraphosphate (Ap4A) HIT family hydrolase
VAIYSDDIIYIEIHESEVPWLKIFTQRPVKEFSECSPIEKSAIWHALDIIEKAMLEYYRPEKINIASFGNMLPHVHWHISARFKEDSYFPEPMWGPKQREGSLELPPMDPFLDRIREALTGV